METWNVTVLCLLLGQPHYQVRFHQVTRQEQDEGRREHASMLVSYDDDKKVISLKTFFNEAFKFQKRCLQPCVPPLDFVLLYMIQSAAYVLTPDFISIYRKMDYGEATALWDIIHDPASTDINGIRSILFDARSYDKSSRKRYFVAGLPRKAPSMVPRAPPAAASNVTYEENRTPTAASASSDTSTSPRAIRIVQELRSRPTSERPPLTFADDDIVELDDDLIEADGESPVGDFQCPPTLTEMLAIVRRVRELTNKNRVTTAVEALASLDQEHPCSSSSEAYASALSPSDRVRSRNYKFYCESANPDV